MTIKSAKNLIIQHFNGNPDVDSISFEDLNSFIFKDDNKNECLTALLGALTTLTSEGVLYLNPMSDVSNTKTLNWVLVKKLYEIEQTIKIPGHLAMRINSIVSDFSDILEDEDLIPDGLEVNETSIMILLDIINMYASQGKDEESSDDGEKIKK